MNLSGQRYINLETTGKRNARHTHTLKGMIEKDEGYFTVESSGVGKGDGIRDRGAAGKSNVAIAVGPPHWKVLRQGKVESLRVFQGQSVIEPCQGKNG